MNRKFCKTLSSLTSVYVMLLTPCYAISPFLKMAQLAQLTLSNGLTEVPSSAANLRQHGVSFAKAVLELNEFVNRFGREGTMRGHPGTALERKIEDSKDGWDSHLSHAPDATQKASQNADNKIQETYKHYRRVREDWSENP